MFYPSTASESTSSYDHQQHFQERGARHARAARVREDDAWTTPGDVVFLVDSPVMFKEILRLQLIPASDFLSPGFVIQRVSGNSTWLEEIGELECFYSGYVEGEEDSVVSLAVCDGMVSGHDFVDLKQLPPPAPPPPSVFRISLSLSHPVLPPLSLPDALSVYFHFSDHFLVRVL